MTLSARRLAIGLLVGACAVALGAGAAQGAVFHARLRMRVVRAVNGITAAGTLVRSGSETAPAGFELVSASSTTVAGIAAGRAQAEGYAFDEAPGRWSSVVASAVLTLSDGDPPDAVAAGDTFVAAAGIPAGSGTGPVTAGVFVEPTGGWSGALQESAILQLPDRTAIDGRAQLAVAGDTVFVWDQGSIWAFDEPADGWGGTVLPSATLTLPAGVMGAIAASGSTVGFSSGGRLWVFSEPAGGWEGTIAPVASLALTGRSGQTPSVAVWNRTIVAISGPAGPGPGWTAEVVDEPATGWAKARHVTASIRRTDKPDVIAPAVAASTAGVMIDSGYPLQTGSLLPCPCAYWLYGLSGVHGSVSVDDLGLPRDVGSLPRTDYVWGDAPSVASVGYDVAIAAIDGIHLYTQSPAPRLVTARATVRRRAAIALHLHAAAAPGHPITKLQIKLPNSLRPRTHRHRWAQLTAPASQTYSRHILTIGLRRPASRLAAALPANALVVDQRLRTALQRLASTHHRSRSIRLAMTVLLSGADGSSRTTDVQFQITR